MKINWALVGFVVANLTFSTLGDVCAELWGVSGLINWFYIGLGINLFTMVSFMLVIRTGGLAITSAVVLILTIILNVSIGAIVFKEPILLQQWLGIALGIFAIFLILNLFKFS